MNRTVKTQVPSSYYNNASDNDAKKGHSKTASAQLQSTFNAAAAAGGSRGTAQSAGDRDRLVNSGTKGPGSDPRR